MRQLVVLGILLFFITACASEKKPESKFIITHNGQFIRNGKPYYYIGANYWYGAILGMKKGAGNRKRLIKELDLMQSKGINNLRILAGAEGPDGQPHRVTPTLQISPGVYNSEILEGLDFLLSEMAKRNMVAVLYINNSWEWSGGYAQYLNWNGYGAIPYPLWQGHTWPEFMKYTAQFHQCSPCKEEFYNHVRYMLNRENMVTGVAYTNDPTIMAWEIGNEPRAFSEENKPLLLQLVKETSALIKSIDHNHLVTTGTEGKWGCEGDMELCKAMHQLPTVDYLTMHIWPYNWNWLDPKNVSGTIDECIKKAGEYMDEHIAAAKELGKPVVFEEFGLPRDGFSFDPSSTTSARDKYFAYSFSKVLKNAKKNGYLAGANFWSYSGNGRPDHNNIDHLWKPGDDIIGDPPQEEQGLNSVFDSDQTMNVVAEYNSKIEKVIK